MKNLLTHELLYAIPMFGMLVAASCSSDNTFEDPQVLPESSPSVIHFTAQMEAKGNGGNQSKAASSDDPAGCLRRVIKTSDETDDVLKADWEVGEEVALIYGVGDDKYKATATITSVSSGVATIEAALTNGSPTNGTPIKMVYPAVAADETQESGINANYLQKGQDGTLGTISDNYDVAVDDGVLVIVNDGGQLHGSLKERATLSNQYSILSLSFSSGSAAVEDICYLSITNETDNEVLATVRCTGLNSVYVALKPIEAAKTIRFTAANSNATYSNTVTLSSIEANMFYRSTLRLNDVGPGVVDLGLPSGTLWATCNVGASAPEEYGDFFAWGETTGYTSVYSYYMADHDFSWANYFDTSDQGSTFNKYTVGGGKTVLDPEDDAATANWGTCWKMPTKAMLTELLDTYPESNTSGSNRREWIGNYEGTGVAGMIFYDASDNIVFFLPAAGFRSNSSLINQGLAGIYRSSELYETDNSSCNILSFYSPSSEGLNGIINGLRMTGYSVRPVLAQ